ncbi:MAG: efflux RND transporter periplasmic adaptor subunit [Parachlamydiales bacterium]|nr:efflux RND transporter periplasmic adaptor subunit [Candidatus Acheromyda pituitae]
MSGEATPPLPHNSKAKKVLINSIVVLAVLGAAYFCYYWFYSRFYEYTDDAYVGGNMVFLTPQVPGVVTAITADDTDYVVKGRILVELDKTDATIALDKASADLGNAIRDVVAMFEKVEQLRADIARNKAIFIRSAQDFEHRQGLIEEGAVSTEDLEHAAAALQASYADLVSTEHQYISAIAQIENTTVETHPKVLFAKEKLKEAYVNLNRCTILSPVTGLIAQRNVQVGKQVKVSEPMLAIIPLDQVWVDANFKEVQLSKMRIGQPVEVYADLWGSSVPFHGTVIGIGGGTGSVFSVLPPQNATGNWIKIVQRIPVRIGLPPEEVKNNPLRLGMSMEVTVDIRNTELSEIPPTKPATPIYETDVLSHQEHGVGELIDQIMNANLSPTFLENRPSPMPNEEG